MSGGDLGPNPYAPPKTGIAPYESGAGPIQARLEGDALVIAKTSRLPALCLKCGSREGITYRAEKFQWSPRWARLSVVFCTVGGLVAVFLTRKRAELAIPLCLACNARWNAGKNALIGGAVLLVAGIFSFQFASSPNAAALMFFGVLFAFVALAILFVKPRMLQIEKIDDTEVHVKGFHVGAAKELVAAASA